MNSKNRKTFDAHSLSVNLTHKIDLRRSDNYVALLNHSIYYTLKIIKTLYRNKKIKISGTIWDEEFEHSGGSYSILDFQNYFKDIIKKHEILTDKPLIQIYSSRI